MFNFKSLVAFLDRVFLPIAPQPPAEPETEPIARVSEEALRAMYQLGVTAERARHLQAEAQARAIFPLAQPAQPMSLQDAIALIRTAPLDRDTDAHRAGGVMRAEKAYKRTETRLGTAIARHWSPPARPQTKITEPMQKKQIFASAPTALELPVLGKDE